MHFEGDDAGLVDRFAVLFEIEGGGDDDVGHVAGDVDVLGFAEGDDWLGDCVFGGEGAEGFVPFGTGVGALPDVWREVVKDGGVFGAEGNDGGAVVFVKGVEPFLDGVGDVGFGGGEGWSGEE